MAYKLQTDEEVQDGLLEGRAGRRERRCVCWPLTGDSGCASRSVRGSVEGPS